jgi:hypothetical protein
VYTWIWRRLPGPAAVKAVQAVALVALVAALLWYLAFPWLLPRIPIG